MLSINILPNDFVSRSVNKGLSSNCLTKAIPMGNIITEVAVFEIHMDIKAVAIINPNTIFLMSVPIVLMICKAMRLCKFHFSMAIANINPPIYRKIYLCPKAAVVVDNASPPVSGKRIIGSRAVTLIGTTSKTHHIAIHRVTASTAFAAGVNPVNGLNKIKRIKSKGPSIN